jgi:hypothetical protein
MQISPETEHHRSRNNVGGVRLEVVIRPSYFKVATTRHLVSVDIVSKSPPAMHVRLVVLTLLHTHSADPASAVLVRQASNGDVLATLKTTVLLQATDML